jgi:DNA-binding MarR family transcriptional regulator
VSRHGGKDGENTVRNVNRIMLVSGANLTGITKRLEKAQFIIRKSDPSDDRLKRLEITSKGRQVLKDISDEKERSIKRLRSNGKLLHEIEPISKKTLVETSS